MDLCEVFKYIGVSLQVMNKNLLKPWSLQQNLVKVMTFFNILKMISKFGKLSSCVCGPFSPFVANFVKLCNLQSSLCQFNFTIWETFFLCVWSISTFCCKLCDIVQTLVITLLVQFLEKVPSHHLVQIEFPFKSYQPTCSYNLNSEFCLKKEQTLLPPITNCIVIAHIFLCSPLTPSMFGTLVE